jgi:hypothetical protein
MLSSGCAQNGDRDHPNFIQLKPQGGAVNLISSFIVVKF